MATYGTEKAAARRVLTSFVCVGAAVLIASADAFAPSASFVFQSSLALRASSAVQRPVFASRRPASFSFRMASKLALPGA
eukprot:125830-Rhodomonas_salina.1